MKDKGVDMAPEMLVSPPCGSLRRPEVMPSDTLQVPAITPAQLRCPAQSDDLDLVEEGLHASVIIVDLTKSEWVMDSVCEGIELLLDKLDQKISHKQVLPSIVIFGQQLRSRETLAFQEVGAVVIDQSSSQFKSIESLKKFLKASSSQLQNELRSFQAGSLSGDNSQKSHQEEAEKSLSEFLSSSPLGMTEDIYKEILRSVDAD
jgi:hypothetical protein